MNRITVYSKDNCPACRMVKRLLDDAKVGYSEILVDVRNDTTTLDMLRTAGFRSFPVVLLDEDFDTAMSGFLPPRLREMIRTVELGGA